jgi:hypothetical protein
MHSGKTGRVQRYPENTCIENKTIFGSSPDYFGTDRKALQVDGRLNEYVALDSRPPGSISMDQSMLRMAVEGRSGKRNGVMSLDASAVPVCDGAANAADASLQTANMNKRGRLTTFMIRPGGGYRMQDGIISPEKIRKKISAQSRAARPMHLTRRTASVSPLRSGRQPG